MPRRVCHATTPKSCHGGKDMATSGGCHQVKTAELGGAKPVEPVLQQAGSP